MKNEQIQQVLCVVVIYDPSRVALRISISSHVT